MSLTSKQEKFCIEYVRTGNKSEAYRLAYDAEGMSSETINVKACELYSNGKVSVRVKELEEEIRIKSIYTIEQSLKDDAELVDAYTNAYKTLANPESSEKEKESASRLIRHISTSAYNGAKDRMAKMQGYFEKDNKQTSSVSVSFK